MRTMLVVLISLTLWTSVLEGQTAQTLHPDDAGYAMLRRPMESGAELAKCIRENDNRCLRATPQELLKSFQDSRPELGLRSTEDLALRAEAWLVEPCPLIRLNLARLLLPSRTVDFRFNRWLRTGELCFFDSNLGIYVASAGCGNALVGDHGRDEVRERVMVSLTDQPQVKDTFSTTVARGTRINHNSGAHTNVLKDTTMVFKDPSVWIFRAEDPRVATSPPLTVFVTDTLTVRKGRGPWPFIIGAVIGTGVGWFAHELLVKHKCRCNSDTGGPVDPPNRIAQLRLGFIRF